ncbi:MAG: FAA hydrolase family protein [Acidimicrobiia bacterium]|nr:FAA hydrolase family protein [Acidimicrobiia bacterium]
MSSARFGCVNGRAILVADSLDKYIDIERFSGGKLPSEPMACIERWSDVCSLAASLASAKATDFVPLDFDKLDCPVPRPRQIFAVGVNYKAHAAEMNHGLPKEPLVFTKFQSSLNRPYGQIKLVGEKCDFEAELVAIVGKDGRNISPADAWSHLAGLCVGQDFSDRELQYANTPPQFSLGKSREGFAAIGPYITDTATLSSRGNLEMTCRVSGEVMQHTQTRHNGFYVAVTSSKPQSKISAPCATPASNNRKLIASCDELVTSRCGGRVQIRCTPKHPSRCRDRRFRRPHLNECRLWSNDSAI